MKCQLIAILFSAVAFAQDIDLTGYTLVFEDNFDTKSITEASPKGSVKWYSWPPYGPAGSYSQSIWSIHEMCCVGGILKNEAGWYDRWYSGQISSMDKNKTGFAQQYGYFSARMQMPVAGQGAWPSFWLMTENSIPSNQGDRLEIDILEWYGNQPNVAQHVVHRWKSAGGEESAYIVRPQIPGGNASGQFHIYGCKVAPDFITFYIDGIETGKTATPTTYIGPMYVMVAYALGGGWPVTGEPFASKGKSELWVDWVRVYSLPIVPTPGPTPGVLKGYFEGTLDGIFVPAP